MRDKIIEALSTGEEWKGMSDLKGFTGGDPVEIRATLATLMDEGIVQRKGKKRGTKYALSSKVEEQEVSEQETPKSEPVMKKDGVLLASPAEEKVEHTEMPQPTVGENREPSVSSGSGVAISAHTEKPRRINHKDTFVFTVSETFMSVSRDLLREDSLSIALEVVSAFKKLSDKPSDRKEAISIAQDLIEKAGIKKYRLIPVGFGEAPGASICIGVE